MVICFGFWNGGLDIEEKLITVEWLKVTQLLPSVSPGELGLASSTDRPAEPSAERVDE
jgi:hypothetical protein